MAFQLTSTFFQPLTPFLTTVRQTGFFEASAYMSIATVMAAVFFYYISKIFGRYGRYEGLSLLPRNLRRLSDFSLVWLTIAAFFVAFKTMIVEELDYTEIMWFQGYLPWMHFAIATACGALLFLLLQFRPRSRVMITGKWALKLYVQLALLAGYGLVAHRIWTEDFLGASSGLILLALFVYWQYELIYLSNLRLARD